MKNYNDFKSFKKKKTKRLKKGFGLIKVDSRSQEIKYFL